MKTILITGATDGIGLVTAGMLVSAGHRVLVHGRNPAKLEDVERKLSALPDGGPVRRAPSRCPRPAEIRCDGDRHRGGPG